MKRPQPDLGTRQLQSFIGNVGSLRKFLRLWGTTTVGGVEVLQHRQYYYPIDYRGTGFEKLFRYLGAYDNVVDSDYRGIDSAWMYLNKNKGTTPPSNLNDFVANNLNSMWWDPADGILPVDLTLTTTIIIEGLTDPTRESGVSTTSLLNPYWEKSVLIAAVKSNYDTLWNTCVITQQGVGVIHKGSTLNTVINVEIPDEDDLTPNDPWLSVYSRNVLRTHGPSCNIKSVSIGQGKTEEGRLYPTYVVTIEIPYDFVNPGSLFVEDIVNDLTGTYSSKTGKKLSYPNGYYTKKSITSMSSTDLEDDPLLVSRTYRLWEDETSEQNALFSSLWYNYDGVWYLRADALRKPRGFGLTYKDINYYLWPLVDSDYKKKKVPWWKKFVAAVLFVVVVIASAGTLAPAALAAGILAGSLTLTLLAAVFAVGGDYGWSSAFASINNDIEPLVVIASLITIVNFFSSVTKEASKKAGEALGKELADVTVVDTASYTLKSYVEGIVDNIIQGAKDLSSGTVSKASLQFTTKLSELVMMSEKNKLSDLNNKNKDLKAEYEGLMKELNQESDVLKGFSQVYAKPATADWSIYAATFDQPYERGGGPMALGNIQRTTKQALRKADYSDAPFVGIVGL